MLSGPSKTQAWEQVAKQADFSPAKMALLCAVSERQLQRIFRRHLRCTPSRWLRNLQCHLAKDLISQGYSSKAAAAELKFASESHFCREFKKVFGNPPQSFAPNLVNQLRVLKFHSDTSRVKGREGCTGRFDAEAGAQADVM